MKELLLHILNARLSPEQREWLRQTENRISAGASETFIQQQYTAASRRAGKIAIALTDDERAQLEATDPALRLDGWFTDETTRAVFLLAARARPDEDYRRAVVQCYEFGDSREQQSWLRALSLLQNAEWFVDIAIDACRTNIIPVFEAIACENVYPARYFPELNFNQMILKCLFNGIQLTRVIGLASRLNPELSRMADHYARERRAAGRSVPADIGMVRIVAERSKQ